MSTQRGHCVDKCAETTTQEERNCDFRHLSQKSQNGSQCERVVASNPDDPAMSHAMRQNPARPTYFVSRYSSMPSSPPSRPKPEAFTPPKGAAGFDTMP